ncbi:MAG: hypothetical protein ACXWHF_05655 [Chthoniobacterales bacterium]
MHVIAAIENIFFLVLIAIVGLVRWAMAAAENAKNARAEKGTGPQSPNAPLQRAPAQTEEERVRRFMEALGVPTSNAPPTRTPRRQVTPRIPRQPKGTVRPIDPFPRPRSTVWTPEPVVVAPSPPMISTPPPIPVAAAPSETTVAPQKTSPSFEVHVIDGRADGPAGTAVVRQEAAMAGRSWTARLTNADGLRDAIILREIFGPPRGLQRNLALID